MKKRFTLLPLFIFGVCYTYIQLKDIECKTYCKVAAGYLSGVFVNDQCWCADKISVEKISEKKLVIPSKNKADKISSSGSGEL